MNFEKMYLEEDLFPREITLYEKRDYGFLFYNEENKDSFDSAVGGRGFDSGEVLRRLECRRQEGHILY